MSAPGIVVVGSGASGVHFAETALDRGCEVTMVDVGRARASHVLPDATFEQLKESLDDPCAYFLGSKYDSVMMPDGDEEYYGIPPGKRYVFEDAGRFAQSTGFAPLFSFARGGLAEAWTGGCYPFNEHETADFPFPHEELRQQYDEVARRIGITGEADDLATFMPVHAHLLPPIPFDEHSRVLEQAYQRKRRWLNETVGAYLGRTRVATLTRDLQSRRSCARLGRCLWGCPVDALYTPSHTLDALQQRARFRYLSGLEALHFTVDASNRATGLVARPVNGGDLVTVPVDRLALAAGTLSTASIVLRSVRAATGECVRLSGLMDNRQVLVPFLTLRMLGRPYDPTAYQYHLLGLGLHRPDAKEYVHAQITTLKTALMHPIIQKLPFDLRTSAVIARTTRSALGVVNVNFHDWRRETSWVELDRDDRSPAARVRIQYVPDPREPERLRAGLQTVRRVLRNLGCVLPPGMQHTRPMGASVHYAGVFPMTAADGGRWTSDALCRSRAFPNVILADGSTFPFLPAKNLTFTLMANASRVAAQASR